MKQLILLFLIAATTLSVSAQKDYRDNDRKYNNRDDRYEDKYERKDRRNDRNTRYDKFSSRDKRELRRQIADINRSFDSRIKAVRRQPFTRASVKHRRIQELEYQRRIALNECSARFGGRHYFAGDDRNFRHDRR